MVSTAILCVACVGLGFVLRWMTTRSVLKAGEAMIQAAEKLAGIPEMTQIAHRLLKRLEEQEKAQVEWTTKIEKMDENQGRILTAMLRMGAIRLEGVQSPGSLIVGSRPGLEQEPDSTPKKSGSHRQDAHI